MGKKGPGSVGLILGLLFLSRQAFTSSSVTQHLTINVLGVDGLSTSGNLQTMVIEGGLQPGSDERSTVMSGTYSITSNLGERKVVGMLTGPLPAGVRLQVELEPPPKCKSMGPVQLDQTPRDLLVTNGQVTARGHKITYRLITNREDAVSGDIRTVLVLSN